jgi:hypothetical protein
VWKPKDHYRVHKRQPLDPPLSIWIQSATSPFFKIFFNIIFHLRLDHPNSLFSWIFQTIICIRFSYVGLLPCASTIRRAAAVIIIAAVKGEAQ